MESDRSHKYFLVCQVKTFKKICHFLTPPFYEKGNILTPKKNRKDIWYKRYCDQERTTGHLADIC